MVPLVTTILSISSYRIEIIYTAAFLLSALASAYLARWTTKGLIVYIFTIAVLLAVIKAAILIERTLFEVVV